MLLTGATNKRPTGAPVALDASSVGSNSFTANWKAGVNNTGTYYIDVFKSDGVTYVTSYSNVTVAALLKLVDANIAGLHTYKYRVRAALSVIETPKLRTSWDAVVNVTWTGGSSDIKDALAAITDNSASKVYKLVLPDGVHFEEKAIETKPYIDIYIPPTTSVGFTGSADVVYQDTFIVVGCHNIFGGGTITRTVNGPSSPIYGAYAIHFSQMTTGGTCIIHGMNIQALGTKSKNAIGADITGNNKLYLVNCNLYSEKMGGTNLHNTTGDTNSCSCYFINTNVTLGDNAQVGVEWSNIGSVSGKDFFYIKGGNIISFRQYDTGSGAGETKIYIDPSTICPTKTFASPSSNLNLTDFTTFISTNNLSLSEYSNVVSVTTTSEGSLPYDNIEGIYVAAGLRKMRTAYNGYCVRLRRASDDAEQDFGFSGNALDIAAINTWRSGSQTYIVRLYFQDGTGQYFSTPVGETVNGTAITKNYQPLFVPDRGDGKPEWKHNGDIRWMRVVLTNDFEPLTHDIAFVITGKLALNAPFCIGDGWAAGICLFNVLTANGIVIKNSFARFASGITFDTTTQRVFSMIYKPTYVKTYENSTLKLNRPYTDNAASALFPNLTNNTPSKMIQIGGSDVPSYQSMDGRYNELVMLFNQADTTEMLNCATQAQYWN